MFATRKFASLLSVLVLALMAFNTATAQANPDDKIWEANATQNGVVLKAKYKESPENGLLDQTLEVQIENAPANTLLRITINGFPVGTMTTVAELFRKLARIEQLHADNILEHDRSLRPEQAIAAAKNLWQGSEAPETADPGELHYRMQPYHALKMALAGEQKARDFFEKIARETSSASVRKQALEMAEEEAEHVRLMEDWISRTPAPDEDWAYDPDPPASPD